MLYHFIRGCGIENLIGVYLSPKKPIYVLMPLLTPL